MNLKPKGSAIVFWFDSFDFFGFCHWFLPGLKRVSIIPLEEEEEPEVNYEGLLIDAAEHGMGMYVKELGGNKYIFQFYHEIDIQRVMDRSPWTFKNAALIFERLKPGDVLREVPLHHLDIWVQLHDIRSGFKTEQVV
ncbi:hypothetical protein F8388_001763 [Cannabis sativa]|uniref:DUF4283 domain-containing protein n=1 Tax=Cannabis sativa TaxID=3483 RepID=A0A7J6F2X9_CANSA|nr:hypothetical protein F8388_001763 [Cannabis sativa]